MYLNIKFGMWIEGDDSEQEDVRKFNEQIERDGLRDGSGFQAIDLTHFNDLCRALGDIRQIIARARATMKKDEDPQ